MDLSFTANEDAFRAEVRGWLSAHRPHTPLESLDTAVGFEQHREWERVLFDGGWSVPHWPEKYGGRDCSLVEWLIYEEEYYASGVPGRVSSNGISLLAPTIFEFGTPEQQDWFLPRMASGEHIWAQGWSEPDAGSDLASISTRAVRDGDHFVLNGQKTWCSRGAYADWIFCIVRTDPDSERHAGLSYLLVPAETPGLERRIIRRLDGEPNFAELFFSDARVDAKHLLGAEGAGWSVAMATAGSERGLNLRAPGRFTAAADRLIDLVKSADVAPSANVQDGIVDGWMRAQAYRMLTYQTAARLSNGDPIGSEASYMKVFWSELDVDLHQTALRLAGPRSELVAGSSDAVANGRWLTDWIFALSGPIYAGTNEIQRNIIAERVLGLPRR